MTPDQVVSYFGGCDESVLKTSIELRCSPQAIYRWMEAGEIPRARQLEIQEQTKGRLKADPRPES